MKPRLTLALAALLTLVLPPLPALAQSGEDNRPEEREIEKYQLGKKSLGVQGYDPVSYFEEGGAKPRKGSKKIEHVHRNVRYRFASHDNLELFKEDPDKYEPAYGGWCAYAIAKEDYTKPNPKRFVIQNGRLMLFYDGLLGDTHKSWHKEGPEQLEALADDYWRDQTGEEPPEREEDKP